jgi:hypothetical protein
MLQQYLELNNIPYAFTSSDKEMFKNIKIYQNQSLETLEKLVNKDYWIWFPEQQGFYTWAQHEKFPFGTTHPLEEAHLEAEHIVYENLRHIRRVP